jgi:hypothetical protein
MNMRPGIPNDCRIAWIASVGLWPPATPGFLRNLFVFQALNATQMRYSATGTLLAVPGLSNSSTSQALLIIAGIFGLFGFIFSIYLATQIGDRKAGFSAWFLVNPFNASILLVR